MGETRTVYRNLAEKPLRNGKLMTNHDANERNYLHAIPCFSISGFEFPSLITGELKLVKCAS